MGSGIGAPSPFNSSLVGPRQSTLSVKVRWSTHDSFSRMAQRSNSLGVRRLLLKSDTAHVGHLLNSKQVTSTSEPDKMPRPHLFPFKPQCLRRTTLASFYRPPHLPFHYSPHTLSRTLAHPTTLPAAAHISPYRIRRTCLSPRTLRSQQRDLSTSRP